MGSEWDKVSGVDTSWGKPSSESGGWGEVSSTDSEWEIWLRYPLESGVSIGDKIVSKQGTAIRSNGVALEDFGAMSVRGGTSGEVIILAEAVAIGSPKNIATALVADQGYTSFLYNMGGFNQGGFG